MRSSNNVANIKEVTVPIVGTAPLVMHKWRCGTKLHVIPNKMRDDQHGNTTNN